MMKNQKKCLNKGRHKRSIGRRYLKSSRKTKAWVGHKKNIEIKVR
jgi:hypothetical protein